MIGFDINNLLLNVGNQPALWKNAQCKSLGQAVALLSESAISEFNNFAICYLSQYAIDAYGTIWEEFLLCHSEECRLVRYDVIYPRVRQVVRDHQLGEREFQELSQFIVRQYEFCVVERALEGIAWNFFVNLIAPVYESGHLPCDFAIAGMPEVAKDPQIILDMEPHDIAKGEVLVY